MIIIRKNLFKYFFYAIYRKAYVQFFWLFPKLLPEIRNPHIIELELTNNCNLACIHCHRKKMKKDLGYFDINLFRKLVDEISTYPIAFLRIVGRGEPTLYPKLEQIMGYLKTKQIIVELCTNGFLFENNLTFAKLLIQSQRERFSHPNNNIAAFYRFDPWRIGKLIKQTVFDSSGLLCSVGLSGDRSTAKWAAKQMKPNGLTVIKPELAGLALADIAVTELCGVNKGIGSFLAQYGVHRCADMQNIPISVLGQRFGNPGRRIWLMAQGKDPQPVDGQIAAAKTLGHGKIIPPNTTDRSVILTYLMHMVEKVAARLRHNQLQAQLFSFAFKTVNGWQKGRSKTIGCTDDGKLIFQLCKFFFQQKWQQEGVFQVHVAALDPRPETGQQDLFIDDAFSTDHFLDDTFPNDTFPKDIEPRRKLHQTIDRINHRYGEFTLCNAPLINRSSMPNVIAPAWKPDGHRNTLDH